MSWDSVLKNTWEEEAREFLEEYASDTLDAVDRMSLELQKVLKKKYKWSKIWCRELMTIYIYLMNREKIC